MIEFPESIYGQWIEAEERVLRKRRLQADILRARRVEDEVENLRLREAAAERFREEKFKGRTPELVMGTAAELLELDDSEPDDLIDGVLKDQSVLILLGKGGSGKTTLGLQMGYSLITGKPFLGRDVLPIEGKFGILSHDMNRRLMLNWISGPPDLDRSRVHLIDLFGRGKPLTVPSRRQEIVSEWRKQKVEVILIDSFSASFAGESQNDTTETMEHYADLKHFAFTEVGARALMVVTHAGWSDGTRARGSSAHHDQADSIASVEVEKVTETRIVTMEKYRAGLGQEKMPQVRLTAPSPVTHLVSIDFTTTGLAGGSAAALMPEAGEFEEPDGLGT